jgi:hypothetical protein
LELKGLQGSKELKVLKAYKEILGLKESQAHKVLKVDKELKD